VTSPSGSGIPPGSYSHASPPSPSGTSFGALSRYFSGSHLVQRTGGSNTCESAEMMAWFLLLCGDVIWASLTRRPVVGRSRDAWLSCRTMYPSQVDQPGLLLSGIKARPRSLLQGLCQMRLPAVNDV